MLKELNDRKNNKLVNVKQVLDSHGFHMCLTIHLALIKKPFHLLFKEMVLDVFKQSWCNGITLNSFLYLLKYFKSSVDF